MHIDVKTYIVYYNTYVDAYIYVIIINFPITKTLNNQ